MEIILAVVILTFAVSLFASLHSAANPGKNVILNVTLPREAQKDPGVQEITRRFKRANLLVFLGTLAVSPPLVLIPLPSVQILVLVGWAAGAIIVGSRVMTTYSRQLTALKSKNQWLVGNTHTITVDLEVSRTKRQMPVSRLWFLPSLAAAVMMLVTSLVWEGTSYIPGIASLPGILIYYYLYTLSARESARAYCDNTEINLACSRIFIRMWTLCWTVLAGVHTLGMAVFLIPPFPSTGLLTAAIGIEVLLTLAVIILTAGKIRRTQNRLLEGAEAPLYVDDDYYWQGGFYNNPNDSRTMVEKRFGYGYTINVATAKGKLAYYSLLIGLPLLLLGVFLPLLSFDTADFDLKVTENQVVIDAPFYGYQFPVNDIISVTTIDTLPSGAKTNGAATSKYSLGNFSLQGYGKSKMYVYKGHPPYIAIELPGLYVIFNAKTPEKTREYHELLLQVSGE